MTLQRNLSLRGAMTAIVTPFGDDGRVDETALRDLARWQVDSGIHGLVPCGTTGESPTLSASEHDRVVSFVVEKVDGRLPVVAGTGAHSTSQAVSHTENARRAGADAALVVTPYYNRPTPRGLEVHYRRLAVVGLPIVIYHIPSRTGTTLSRDTYRSLAQIPEIVATKEASGDLALIDSLLANGTLPVFSGDDSLTFPLLCLGACGVISVVSNVAPRPMVDLYDYVREGNLTAAREQHRGLAPLMSALSLETNPGPVKAALALKGRCEDILRAPLVSVRGETRQAIAEVLRQALPSPTA